MQTDARRHKERESRRNDRVNPIHIEHELSEDERLATIRIAGLAQDLRILHVSDSHMAAGDQRDAQAAEHVAHFQEVFAQRTPGGVPAREVFAATLRAGRERGLEALVLTGDIIHLPTRRALELVAEGVEDVGVPSLYALGNHDWHFPDLPWNSTTRTAHYPRFHALTEGDPACQSRVVDGVRLIALDNSTYQLSAEQLRFLRAEVAQGDPCLLFFHIPLWVPSLTPEVVEMWQAPIMMAAREGWTAATRERWKVPGDDPSTREAYEFLVSGDSENVVGIFCGHVHFAHTDAYRPGRYQYVCAPGFSGGYRVIELRGMD